MQEQLHWFCGAARALFSDNILTFRVLESLMKALELPVKEFELGKALQRKMPQLGQLSCERVSYFVLQLHARFASRLSLDPTKTVAERNQQRACIVELANEVKK